MQKQFWNNDKTDRSLLVLRSLSKGIGFVLIGGWAVYMYVNSQKSEDVDIAVEPDRLDFFRRHGISEYEGLPIKYSVVGGTIVNLFINGYADQALPVPVSRIMSDYTLIDDIKVVRKELLLLLKLWGYFRSDDTKLRKDMIDVLTLVFYGGIDLRKFARYISEYKIEKRRSTDVLLEYLDRGAGLWEYVCPSKDDFVKLKAESKRRIMALFGY
jgi:hypothetical protein